MSDYWKLSAAETADLVRERSVSAREVAEDAIARLQAVNPRLNAVVQETGDEAMAAAEVIDAKLADGKE